MPFGEGEHAGRDERGGGAGRLLLIASWLMLLVVVAGAAAYVMALPPDWVRPAAQQDVRLALDPAPEPPPEPAAQPDDPPAALDGDAPYMPDYRMVPIPDTAREPGPPNGGADRDGLARALADAEALVDSADGIPPPPEAEVEPAPEAEDAPPPVPEPAAEDPPEAAAEQPVQSEPGDTEIAAVDPAATPEDTPPAVVTVDPAEAEPRTPAWQRHARSLTPPPGRPRIAVVVQGLGLSSAASEAAIERLPAAISLSFTPYARRAQEWAGRARAHGHEVLIDLPMEPRDFPARDPGPQALMADAPAERNLDRLDWALARGQEVVGVVAQMGSRFLDEPGAVEPVLRELEARGLMFLDNGELADSAALNLARRLDLPHAVNDRRLDDGQVSRRAIESRLIEVERIARQDGVAVALAQPFPVTIDLLESWSRDLDERGYVLIPITQAVAARLTAEAGR